MKKRYVIFYFMLIYLIIFPINNGVLAKNEAPLKWGFKKGNNEQQADAGDYFNKLLTKHGAIYKGNPNDKFIYLTFDNGYENGNTEPILDILKRQQVPATFFITGHYLKTATPLVKRMITDGHLIGNHSYGHLDFASISNEKIRIELETMEEEMLRLTGSSCTKYIRVPEGSFSESALSYTQSLGYQNVFWSVAYVDWNADDTKGDKHAYESIMTQVHPGSIILLHTVSKDNAKALEKIITDLKEKEYKFLSLDDFQ